MRCPGVTWIRKIIRKLLVLYSLPPIPRLTCSLCFSQFLFFFFSEGRAHLHEDDAPTGPRRVRHRQPVPKVPRSLPSYYLCICCCMYAVRLPSLQTVLFYLVPVARDKLVPAPATAPRGWGSAPPHLQFRSSKSIQFFYLSMEMKSYTD